MKITARVAARLRREPVGGALLVVAAIVALAWANSPWGDVYSALSATVVGPAALHLDLPLATWASDGLLAVFFFVAGLELKGEFVDGELRRPGRAAVPIAAAVGGMAAPAVIYTVVVTVAGAGAARAGWAVPMATDIAFALAVLAVLGRSLPPALRTFLLTLAVVDDLIAITVIAVFYTAQLSVGPLLAAVVPLAAFGVLVRRRTPWAAWSLPLLAVVTWGLVHASGVHATVAGVALGFVVPVRDGTARRLDRRWRPVSVGLALPVFAFFAAGVPVGDDVVGTLTDPVTLGIVAGLVGGKVVGICVTTAAVQRLTPARLDAALRPLDVFGVSLLAGIGFTVSLLISELAFADDTLREHARTGVLAASVLAALLAAAVLVPRNRRLLSARPRSGAPAPGTSSPPGRARRRHAPRDRGCA